MNDAQDKTKMDYLGDGVTRRLMRTRYGYI